ncbi:MAG: amidophosphoribosyltransferase [Dehalococcoidia bacterium]|jgi:amidophosphoribosyltransferase|nr:amidophosphoribosyltransferase [Chloroflexota bacterium]MDP6425376.1 amidophosphoribosyltransferase [Dehalococcoidia bacterium]MDP7231888.1 amidophosphoribosyltransferase [Dehalococcoidia bacterium]MDP7613027.1 amidophosphoribosyltransferase [Dehalococcoidia bacterium]
MSPTSESYLLPSNDKPREACGIVGVYMPNEDVAKTVFFSLFALQHRGQESAGIAVSDGKEISNYAKMGLVSQVFREESLKGLSGFVGIGHTRYSTMGGSKASNAQPLLVNGPRGLLAVGHNGNVINANSLREEISKEWQIEFERSSDTEIIAELYVNTPGIEWFDVSATVMRRLSGAYSLVMMNLNELIAVRDPLGIRPLCLGKLREGWVVASETAALDTIGATIVRELKNGETLVINKNGIKSQIWSGSRPTHAMCVFEHIYFARPDSILNGKLAYETRLKMGAELWKEAPVSADFVTGIPDSSTPHAVGFARESGIPYVETLIKNRYVGRTFIEPDQHVRDDSVKMKFNVLKSVIKGKKLIVVDDSIVRSTTITRVVKLLRNAGAKEIHVRVAAPAIKSTCHFGVDMATLDQLIASNMTIEEITNFIGADSLSYLSISGLMTAVENNNDSYCRGCFTGEYPIPVQLEMDKFSLESK